MFKKSIEKKKINRSKNGSKKKFFFQKMGRKRYR